MSVRQRQPGTASRLEFGSPASGLKSVSTEAWQPRWLGLRPWCGEPQRCCARATVTGAGSWFEPPHGGRPVLLSTQGAHAAPPYAPRALALTAGKKAWTCPEPWLRPPSQPAQSQVLLGCSPRRSFQVRGTPGSTVRSLAVLRMPLTALWALEVCGRASFSYFFERREYSSTPKTNGKIVDVSRKARPGRRGEAAAICR